MGAQAPVTGESGHPGVVLVPPSELKTHALALQRIAVAKLTGITILSAEFDGDQAVFQPWLSLVTQSPRSASYLGVYCPAHPREDGDTRPDLCWRRSEWDRDADLRRVRSATDHRAYLASDQQIESEIGFTHTAAVPELMAVIESSLDVFRRGVTVSAATRPHAPDHDVRVEVADDTVCFELGFSPLLATAPVLERWLPVWRAALGTLRPDARPDGEIKVSYEQSWTDLARLL